MKKRKRMSRSLSKKVFRRAAKVHRRNVPTMPMRGGIRL